MRNVSLDNANIAAGPIGLLGLLVCAVLLVVIRLRHPPAVELSRDVDGKLAMRGPTPRARGGTLLATAFFGQIVAVLGVWFDVALLFVAGFVVVVVSFFIGFRRTS